MASYDRKVLADARPDVVVASLNSATSSTRKANTPPMHGRRNTAGYHSTATNEQLHYRTGFLVLRGSLEHAKEVL